MSEVVKYIDKVVRFSLFVILVLLLAYIILPLLLLAVLAVSTVYGLALVLLVVLGKDPDEFFQSLEKLGKE